MAANAIKALIEEGVRLLSETSEQPKLEAEILLSHVTGKSRTHFRAFAEAEVSAAEALRYQDLVEQRQSGQPMAYLTGTREFWSLNFEVTSDVLIPRPETELLVEIALEWVRSLPKPRLLDLGTGSGAIPVSIAKERPDANLTAVDVSPKALALAQKNAHRLGAPGIRFLLGDWLAALPSAEPFDLIVSNPPYISEQDGHLACGDLRFEPRSALASGPEDWTPFGPLCGRREPLLSQAADWRLSMALSRHPSSEPSLPIRAITASKPGRIFKDILGSPWQDTADAQ